MDKLDLLGVKHDYEMELQAKYEIAEEIIKKWNTEYEKDDELEKEDFYDWCIIEISEIIGYDYDDVVKKDTYEIYDIIEKNYLN